MIDWHSHVLPAMDDGSRTAEESLQMLRSLREQGIGTVIATPHFFANEEDAEHFLARRAQAYEAICEDAAQEGIRLLCGAEVRYYPGIGRMQGLEKLTLGDSRLLLLEMPTERWTDFTVRELEELASTRGLRIVMAHIERYVAFNGEKTVRKLCESGLLMQVNASFFERLGSRRRALKLLGEGLIHFIGSDSHNMEMRPPKIAPAYELIEKRFGKEFVSHMTAFGHRKLEKQKN